MRIGLAGIVGPLVIVCALSGCGDSRKDEEARAQLRQRAAERLQAAAAKASAFDFDGASSILADLRTEVNESRSADVSTYDKLTADIEAAYQKVSEQESDYRKRVREGWKVIGGQLVSPADQAKALAEEKRKAAEAAARAEAEARTKAAAERARSEAEAKKQAQRRAEQAAREEQARKDRERDEALRVLAETIRTLPPLNRALDDEQYRVAMSRWISASDADKPLLTKTELVRRIRDADGQKSPVLIAHREEIVDFVETLDWPVFAVSSATSQATALPISFASFNNEPVLLMGAVFSEVVYNEANEVVNTPKKRAATFTQKEVLPRLLKSQLTDRLRAARLGYVGLVFVYGRRNFVHEYSSAKPEALCLVFSTRDFAAFVNRDLTQEALVRNSAIFLAADGAAFMKVELTLE